MNRIHRILAPVVTCAVLGLVGTASAQQLEYNDAGGSLKGSVGTVTTAGFDIPNPTSPIPGLPLCVDGDDLVALRAEGAPAAPLILLLGQLDSSSTALPSPSTEYLDLDLTSFVFVIADGFTGQGGLPVFDDTNANGVASYVFPMNPSINFDFAFQAVIADPGSAFGLNFTAAVAYTTATPPALPPFSTTGTAITGDDTLGTATLANPICVYGTSYTTLKVSTNGWISFGSAETVNDLSETIGEFTTGNPGSTTVYQGPLLAVGWDDLDLGNRPTQGVAVEELAPGVVQIRYVDADRFSADNIGDMTAVIDSSSGSTVITLSYDLNPCYDISNWTPLIGLSAGTATATVTAVDFATDGVVNATAATGGVVSIYEYFSPAGDFDLHGLTVTFLDAGGCTGDFFVF